MTENSSKAKDFPVLSRIGWVWNHSIGWILTQVLVWPIKGYQRFISPMTPPSCRLYPSCSSYAVESITVHGPLKGFVLASWRLLRCNPWNKGGVDPVPTKGHWLPDVLPNGEPRRPTPPVSGGAPHAAPPGHGTMDHLHPDDGIERRAS